MHIVLEDERARLEPLSEFHFNKLLPYALAYPNLLQYSPIAFGSEDGLRQNFLKLHKLRDLGTMVSWAIFDKQENAYAGSTSYLNISKTNKRLEIGATWLAPPFHRTGLNRHCKFLLLTNAFESLDYVRVELKTDGRNLQSQEAIKAIGAQYEGALRSHTVMMDGYRRDTLYYSILKDEWPAIRTTLKNSLVR